MDITSGVATAISLARKLLELKSLAKDAEAKLIIADLQLALAEVKSQLADVMEFNLQLRTDLAKAQSPPDVVFKDSAYYRTDGDGPFCTTCFDKGKQLIRLTELATMFHGEGRYLCGICKNRFLPVKMKAAMPIIA